MIWNSYMEAFELKWVNPIFNIIGVNSLKLWGLHIKPKKSIRDIKISYFIYIGNFSHKIWYIMANFFEYGWVLLNISAYNIIWPYMITQPVINDKIMKKIIPENNLSYNPLFFNKYIDLHVTSYLLTTDLYF